MKENYEAHAAEGVEQGSGEKGNLSRRQALLAGGTLALGGLAASLLGGCSPASESKSDTNEWDEEADVVIIGGGTGIYTALRTNAQGLKTIVLEKGDSAGGSTLFSTSVVWAPNNASMKTVGQTDSREEALAYIEAGSAETYLPEMAEAFVDTINTALANVTELASIEWDCWAGGIDYRSSLPGGKTFGRSLVPRVAEGESTAGALEVALIEAANSAGVNIMTKTKAIDLIVREKEDGSTEVIGVRAEKGGKQIRVKATTAVVMAAGGFDWNDSMMTNYLRVPAHYSWGVSYAEGDAHKMAMKAGCDLRFMNEGWFSPGYKEQHEEAKEAKTARFASAITDYGKPGLIYVNKHGKRFTNECSNYDSLGRSFCSLENAFEPRGWQNLPAFALVDQKAVDAYSLAGGKPGSPGTCFKSYETLAELAAACDIDTESLEAEVARFNENAALGLDPDFGRGQDYYGQNYMRVDHTFEGPARTLAPLANGPYWAAEVVPVVLGTMGGITTNVKSQAIDTNGETIGRLYAHGNCAGHGCGGAFYTGGGGTLGPALAFGELAASDIETLTVWE